MIHNLTQISMVKNIDGVHTEKTTIGYIAADPEVVLDYFLLYCFVSGYNNELYPIYETPFNYSISIEDAGRVDGFYNADKLKVFDIDTFIDLYNDQLQLATPSNTVSEMYTERDLIDTYMSTLKNIANSNKDIELAIDAQTVIEKGVYCKSIKEVSQLFKSYPSHEKLIRYMVYTLK